MKRTILTAGIAGAALALAACGGYSEEEYNAEANAAYDAETAGNYDAAAAGSTAYGGNASDGWPEGARIVEENGIVYRVDPDGTRVELQPGDSRIVIEDGVRFRVDPDGTRIRIDEEGAAIDADADDVQSGLDVDVDADADAGLSVNTE